MLQQQTIIGLLVFASGMLGLGGELLKDDDPCFKLSISTCVKDALVAYLGIYILGWL